MLQGLAAMQRYQGPNCLVLSRSTSPPIPGLLVDPPGKEEPGEGDTSTGSANKRELVGISKRSSLNLVRLLSTLDWKRNGQCYHVSFTYGRIFPSSKNDLAAEKSGIVRDLGRAGFVGIWRLEYQSRESEAEKSARIFAGEKRTKGQGGSRRVPHWHILLWDNKRDPAEVECFLRGWWKRFSGNGSRFGVEIRTGDARATWYLSLHAGKKNQSPPFAVGRWWGYIDRSSVISSCDVQRTGKVTEREHVWVARLFRRATGARTRPGKGFTWFLPRRWQYEVNAWVNAQIKSEKKYEPF